MSEPTPAPQVVYGGHQTVDRFGSELGLPSNFFSRPTVESGLCQDAQFWIENSRPARQNFWPALVLALVAQAESGLALLGNKDSLDDVFAELEVEESSGGRTVNTLNFVIGDEFVRLRGAYNQALDLIRVRMRRYGHPMNPGHATQAWRDYRPLIEIIWRMLPGGRRCLVEWVWEHGVLALDETETAAAVARPVRPLEQVLANMPTASNRPGSIWQGICFGYLGADSPNLQLESAKAQTGSRRSGLTGDVDGFIGERVALTAECKDLHLDEEWRNELGDFVNSVAQIPGVTAVVMCSSATPEAIDGIRDAGIVPLTRETMMQTASVWDDTKQWTALRGLFYYLHRVQKDEKILRKVREWCLDQGIKLPEVESDTQVE